MLVESTKYVNGRVHYKLDFKRIHGHVSRKHIFAVYNTPTSTTNPGGFLERSIVRNCLACFNSKYNLRLVYIPSCGGDGIEKTEDNESGSSHEVRKNKQKRKPYGMIKMYVPPTLPIKEKNIEKFTNIKPGV